MGKAFKIAQSTLETLTTSGSVTLGDASGDSLTINSSAVSIPNGLNFDSNTLVVDATNNRVGVGTNVPGGRLTVVGASANTFFVVDQSGNGENYFAANSVNIFQTAGTERMRIDSSGNVGIGTSSPATIVHAQKSSGNTYYRAQNNLANVDFGVDGAGTGILWNNGNYPLAFGTNNTERMRITSGGAVGIGTSTPSTRLDVSVAGAEGINLVNAASLDSPRLFFTNSNGTGNSAVISGANGDFRFGTGGTVGASSGTERMRITTNGNVGIGTSSPGGALSVATGINALQVMYFGTTNGRMLGKFFANGGVGAKTINLLTITSFSSNNTRVFVNVKVSWVDPIADQGNTATAWAAASQGGTRTQGSFTTSQVWSNGTVGSLSWSGGTLRLTTPGITYGSGAIDVEFVAFDGASITFDTSNQ